MVSGRWKHNKSMTFLTDPSSPFLTCKRAPSDDGGSDNFSPVCCCLEHSKLAVFQRIILLRFWQRIDPGGIVFCQASHRNTFRLCLSL